MRVSAPTIGGHVLLRLGRAQFGVPRGSRIAHVTRGGKKLAYVIDPSQRLHVFNEDGEILGIPAHLQRVIRQQIFKT